MFSHDVVDAAQSAIPLALESQRYGFAPSQNRISDFMIGRAVVGVLMLESNGVISPSVENWNADEIEFVRQEINQALQWWTQQSQAGNVRLEFVIPSNHPLTVPTRYEPIQMIGLEEPFGQADVWINDAMIYLGYNDPSKSYLDRVRQYDDDLRRAYQADWAFTIFVVNGTNDGDGFFAPGSWGIPDQVVSAWAQRPGPYVVINNLSAIGVQWPNKYYLDGVVAHEIGHVFGAADEVWGSDDCTAGSECRAKFGYLSIENQNCDCTPSCILDDPQCVMRVGDLVHLCSYSAGQVGWRDSNSNGKPDPVDTKPQLIVNNYPPNPSSSHILSYVAQVTDLPYTTTQVGYISVTINTVFVQYQIGGTSGAWSTALAGDGAWDSPYEENFKIPIFDNGTYTIYLRAINEVGNTSAVVSHAVTINSSEPVYRIRLPLVLRNS